MPKSLCIDIGGTRIKGAILPDIIDGIDLSESRVISMPTLGWLNGSMPKVIDPQYWASIAKLLPDETDYDRVLIAVPGPVRNGEFIGRKDLTQPKENPVPEKLESAFQSIAKSKKVRLFKDADAWIGGCSALPNEIDFDGKFPKLLLACGTGFGVSIASSNSEVQSVEISSSRPADWPKLQDVACKNIAEGYRVHGIVGRGFFDWVQTKKQHWDLERIRREYTCRVSAFIMDMSRKFSNGDNCFKTIFIGGGFAEFVSVRGIEDSSKSKVVPLTERLLGFKPEFVPLLGLQQLHDRIKLADFKWR